MASPMHTPSLTMSKSMRRLSESDCTYAYAHNTTVAAAPADACRTATSCWWTSLTQKSNSARWHASERWTHGCR
eukprot:357617-Chlamydomonas_euryale.AAC.1